MSPRISDLRDRVRIEALSGAAWALQCVVSAAVLPIAPRPASALAASLAAVPAFAQAGSAFEITIRYRTDLTRAMRIRRGSDVLVITSIDDVDGQRLWLKILCETFLTYATRHDTALAAAVREGAPITFTRSTTSSTNAATYDPNSDTLATPVATTTISGYAIEDVGQREYQPGLTHSVRKVLTFIPTTYGDLPAEGASCIWGGETLVVEKVEPIAPDAVVMGAKVTVTL